MEPLPRSVIQLNFALRFHPVYAFWQHTIVFWGLSILLPFIALLYMNYKVKQSQYRIDLFFR